MPVKLGEELVWCNGKLKAKQHLCYVVDFLTELKNYLNNPYILQHILERDYSTNEIYADFCNGEAFRNHPVFQEDRRALQVIAYEDDLEVVNPLGSKVKIHKIAVFYWFLGNIHPRHRSSARHIHLMCIALTKHVKQYGIDRMVANFISGVNKLTEGYIMNLRGEEKLVNGALLAFIGDTLSSNFIAGFKESVSFAERKCRTCLCSTQDMKTKFSDEEFDKRDLQQHLHHCELLSNSTTKQEKQHWSKTYGVTHQMLLLCEILPFLIGQKLPQHDHRWKSFQLLRQIVRLSSSFALHERHISMLRVLIQEHHQLFVEVYGEENFMPKHHFMTHFPAQIQRFGPLRQHWCMRLEAKHNFFKNEVSCNFKNLAKSLSQRHQLWMCSQLVPGNTEAFLYAGHELRGGTSLPVADSDYRVALERNFKNWEKEQKISSSFSVLLCTGKSSEQEGTFYTGKKIWKDFQYLPGLVKLCP
ncbi:uncharacterized protein [Ptychodera flava]|uniref:uncharacterized protein isoform X2 n=1 Tax=Ptychodera flava TaxID=63121 RepID=UPI003969D49E